VSTKQQNAPPINRHLGQSDGHRSRPLEATQREPVHAMKRLRREVVRAGASLPEITLGGSNRAAVIILLA
jgi:hypothetical protein